MRVAVYHGKGDVRLEDRPVPVIGPGELLVKIEACGICGSDLMDWYLAPRAPLVLGHEPAGTVAAVGKGVRGFRPGGRVFIHHHVPCGTCALCRKGRETLCAEFHTSRIEPGGFAEYVRVPAAQVRKDVLKIPDSLPLDVAAVIEPVACIVRGWRRVPDPKGARVAVIGCGFAGQVMIRLARLKGAARVTAVDPVPERRALATRSGADAHETLEGEHDLVVVCAGHPDATRAAVRAAAPGGTVLLFAPTPAGVEVPLDTHRMFFKEITVVTTYSAGPRDTREALRLMTGKGGRGQAPPLRVHDLITHRVPLEQAGEALRLAASPTEALKVVLTP